MLLPVLAGLAGLAMMGNPPRKRRRKARKNPTSSGYIETAGVLHSHKDPKDPGAKKHIYEWVHLPSGKTGFRTVWVLGRQFFKLLEDWNSRKPEEWCFIWSGTAANPRRKNPWTHGTLGIGGNQRGVANELSRLRAADDARAAAKGLRDPIYVGAFDADAPPRISKRYMDGDSAAVASPYKPGTWEVWVYGTIDPAMGDSWNLAEKNLTKGAAIGRAHEIIRY